MTALWNFLDSEGQEGAQERHKPSSAQVASSPRPQIVPVSDGLVSATEQLSQGSVCVSFNEATCIHVKTAPRDAQCTDPSPGSEWVMWGNSVTQDHPGQGGSGLVSQLEVQVSLSGH